MPIKWSQTLQEKIEVAEWIAGTGPVTQAVQDATIRFGVTFGAALITRKYSAAFKNNLILYGKNSFDIPSDVLQNLRTVTH